MKISTLIVDDEPIAREGLAEYAGKIDVLEVKAVCKNAVEANSVIQHTTVDLIFLDIKMPELSGLDWFKSLSHPPLTIITTAFREFAVDGFELEVVDYLVKPIPFERFLKACNKVVKLLDGREQAGVVPEVNTNLNAFFIKKDQQYVKIGFDEVYFIEGLKDYVAIHTRSKKHLALISLKSVEEKLPKSSFMRVHRSFIVALDKIEAIDGNRLKIGGKEVPTSREMQDKVYSQLVKDRLWKRGE